MIRWYCISLLIALCYPLSGQETGISLNNFLASFRTHTPYQLQSAYTDQLRSADFKLPLIEKLEFRTETNYFNIPDQEYAVRLNPNSFSERKWRAAMLASNAELGEAELELSLLKHLAIRYHLALEMNFLKKQIALGRQLLPVLKDVVVKETYQLGGGDADVRDVVQAEEDVQSLEINLFELEARLERVQRKAGLLIASDAADLQDWMLIQPDQMQNLVARLTQALPVHPEIARRQIQARMVEEEIQMESAELWEPLSFLQARYRGQDREIFKEAFSISLGVRVPLKGSTQLEIKELNLEQAEEQYQLEEAKWQLENAMSRSLIEWNYSWDRLQHLQQMIEQEGDRYDPDRFRELSVEDPGAILYLKKRGLEQRQSLLRQEYQLYLRYIDLLQISGQLIAQPLTNYLSAGLEPF